MRCVTSHPSICSRFPVNSTRGSWACLQETDVGVRGRGRRTPTPTVVPPPSATISEEQQSPSVYKQPHPPSTRAVGSLRHRQRRRQIPNRGRSPSRRITSVNSPIYTIRLIRPRVHSMQSVPVGVATHGYRADALGKVSMTYRTPYKRFVR